MNNEAEFLIVEDNPSEAELVLRVLGKHGLAGKCVVFRNGVEALEFVFAQGSPGEPAAKHALKAILLDLKLPKMDGLEVLRRLRADERTKNTPVVVFTSSAQERDIKDAYALGANSYIIKPIRFEEFEATVAELGRYWLALNIPPLK